MYEETWLGRRVVGMVKSPVEGQDIVLLKLEQPLVFSGPRKKLKSLVQAIFFRLSLLGPKSTLSFSLVIRFFTRLFYMLLYFLLLLLQ
jgi:hypothetical protein